MKKRRPKPTHCCKQPIADLPPFGICQPCEEHVMIKRQGKGITFVFPNNGNGCASQQ